MEIPSDSFVYDKLKEFIEVRNKKYDSIKVQKWDEAAILRDKEREILHKSLDNSETYLWLKNNLDISLSNWPIISLSDFQSLERALKLYEIGL
jgi:hypothetical protein